MSIDHNKQRYELLLLGGRNGPGLLTTWLDGGGKIEFLIEARWARLLVVLHRLSIVDAETRSTVARGWRTRSIIAVYLEKLTSYAINADTASAYAFQLMRKLNQAGQAIGKGMRLSLIERRRGLGMRLAEDVELVIVDATETHVDNLNSNSPDWF